jgi:TBC1 domain family protein 5
VTIGHATSLEALKKSVRLHGDESPARSGLRSVCWKVSPGSQLLEDE